MPNDNGESRDTQGTNGHPVSFGGQGFTIAVITASFAFVEELQAVPVSLVYKVFAGTDDHLVSHVMDENPKVIVVVSSSRKSMVSGYRICEEVRRNSTIPVVLVHDGEYANMDLPRVSDMDSRYPSTYLERFNLVLQILRIAHNVPEPSVSLTDQRSTKWRLLIGTLTATATGLISFAMSGDPTMSGQAAAASFFAIIGIDGAGSIRRQARRVLSSRS